ncbi:MAG: sugar kinase [Bacteroidota bacterium]|nr:sugar kinase [Candidatus Kapabacteria bacterium]MDW8221156.1 sugar kinase [Bacteroidota bacterium]
MKIEYAIVVKSKTRLEMLVERFNTKSQARFYIERQGGKFEDYEHEHETFHHALTLLQTQLSRLIKNKVVEKTYLPSFLFSERHVIVVIGQDGLVANTAKYSRSRPIVAVNPDKSRYDGVLLPFDISNVLEGVEDVMRGQYSARTVRFAEARLNDGQKLLAFNDLFIGAASHISARYIISFDGATEEHSSSGLIISTRAGSTGWFSSVLNMAYGVTSLFEHGIQRKVLTLGDNELVFVVREPFQSVRTQIGITVGIITEYNHLTVESLMPAHGVIFSDGIEADFLKFNSGAIAKIGLAEETATLVVP